MKKHYELLKDTPEAKKGTIFVEECNDGDQEFGILNKSDWIPKDMGEDACFSRDTVMKQPKWFRQIYPLWLSKKEIVKVKKFLK